MEKIVGSSTRRKRKPSRGAQGVRHAIAVLDLGIGDRAIPSSRGRKESECKEKRRGETEGTRD